jgi:sugar lactone lactonase YvrE
MRDRRHQGCRDLRSCRRVHAERARRRDPLFTARSTLSLLGGKRRCRVGLCGVCVWRSRWRAPAAGSSDVGDAVTSGASLDLGAERSTEEVRCSTQAPTVADGYEFDCGFLTPETEALESMAVTGLGTGARNRCAHGPSCWVRLAVAAVLFAVVALAVAPRSASAYPVSGFTIWTIAGNGTSCSTAPACGDGGPAIDAQFQGPDGIAVDAAGNVYVADFANSEVRKITPQGTIIRIAGDGVACSTAPACGDGGAATSAELRTPGSVAVNASGDVFIADTGDDEVREVTPAGTITTVAGDGSPCSSPPTCGDGGPATSAHLTFPEAVAVDAAGDLYVADFSENEVREVAPSGTITRFAGTGAACSSPPACGDGGLATSAQLNGPDGVAVDPAGDVFIADANDQEVRKVTAAGTITTIAGGLGRPEAVAADALGDVFIADTTAQVVREVSATDALSTVAGNGTACGAPPICGDGGAATSAQLNSPEAVAVDPTGNVFVADANDHEVRWLTGPNTGTSGTPGSPGPGGAAGSPGTNGGPGPAGPAGKNLQAKLVLITFQIKKHRTYVSVRYALTRKATITLSVRPTHQPTVIVKRGHGHRGVNAITWDLQLDGKTARHGSYRLIVTAIFGNHTTHSGLTIHL